MITNKDKDRNSIGRQGIFINAITDASEFYNIFSASSFILVWGVDPAQ